MQNRHHSYQTRLPLQSFLSTSTTGPGHEPSPSKGRGTTHDTNVAPNMGPMVCGHSATYIQWPGYRAANFQSQMKILFSHWESAKMYDISQVSDFPISGNRVQWLCAHSGWTLSMCITCMNCVCISQRGGICPIHHWGTSKSMVIDLQCSQGGMMVRGQLSEKDPFLQKKLIPGELWCLNMREVAQKPAKTQADLQFGELTLLTEWANSTNVSKCQGHVTILSARSMNFLF